MRMTQEADYALRIAYLLAEDGGTVGAARIAADTEVTPRFALKILRKLVLGGLVGSQKGANGGYRLVKAPCEFTVRDVIELIDGPIAISKCMDAGSECSKRGNNKDACIFHNIFRKVNGDISEKLSRIDFAMLTDENSSIQSILQILDQ